MEKKIIDFIDKHPSSLGVYNTSDGILFIVDNAKIWNDQNINSNPNEYVENSFSGKLKSKKYEDGIRYGVISASNFSNALIRWNSMYLASLFFKDVEDVYSTNGIKCDISINRDNVLYYAMMDTSNVFNYFTLFDRILSFSIKNRGLRKKYIEENMERLKQIYNLYSGNSMFNIYGEYFMVDHDRLFLARKSFLPEILNGEYDKEFINKYNVNRIQRANRKAINSIIKNDVYNDAVLNDTYNYDVVKNDSFKFKR